MVKCTGMKTNGFPCIHNAKKDTDRCGTHSHDKFSSEEEETVAYKIYLKNRYMFLQNVVDYNQRIGYRTSHNILGRTIPEITTLIAECEALLAPDYPGYLGLFVRGGGFIPFRIVSDKRAAEMRCIHAGNGNIHSIPLLHDWYDHFFMNLQIVILDVQLNQLYNVEYVVGTLTPIIVARYNEFDQLTQHQLHRCFRNMEILGQLYISSIRLLLPVHLPNGNNLAGFVQDNQNVHKQATVKHVLHMFDKLQDIPLLKDQNTLGSIIMKCKLPPTAIIQLTRCYCESPSIYEIPGAYAKALDRVWAYIEMHPEKEELYSRVRDEMIDNVGMCLQGNLSRICNILSGYLDGVQPIISQGEMLQNAISSIANDTDGNKVERAKKVLKELHVPEDQWTAWIEALE